MPVSGVLKKPSGTGGRAVHSDAAATVRRLQLRAICLTGPPILLDRAGELFLTK